MRPRLVLLFLAVALRPCAALVRLHSNSFSFTFLDAPARFGPRVGGDGICGSLRVAKPAEACEPIKDSGGRRGAGRKAFVLIARGNCSFEGKVRVAQKAGFDAAVVYDDEEKASLYSMVGDSEGIHIPAIFVSKMAGETLKKFARGEDDECCINSSMNETAGTVLVMSFISLVVIISVLASFLFARNCRLLRHGVDNHPPYVKKHVVEELPCSAYSVHDGGERREERGRCLCGCVRRRRPRTASVAAADKLAGMPPPGAASVRRLGASTEARRRASAAGGQCSGSDVPRLGWPRWGVSACCGEHVQQLFFLLWAKAPTAAHRASLSLLRALLGVICDTSS